MIEVKNLSKIYDGKLVLKDVSCVFANNCSTAIVGPSGSGKTTLIRCLNLLDTPDSGSIDIDGRNVASENAFYIHEKIGFVFQNFNLFQNMNILENLLFAPVLRKKFSRNEAVEKAKFLLASFNLYDKNKEMPSNLSGGQKQRVAICRALMMDPEVIVFDEPTSALDPESVGNLIEIINDLRQTKTLIVVTHHVGFAKKIADQVIFMDKGQILSKQKCEDFFESPNSMRAKIYLEKAM